MYNQEIKQRYLDDIDSSDQTKKIISTYFIKSEEVETILGKDISCFNLSEIIGYYKSLNTASVNYLATINSQLLNYTTWCQSNGIVIDNQNHYREVDKRIYEECINKYYVSKKYVSREDLFELINRSTVDIGDKFLLLALFEGICGNKYIELRNLYPKDFKKNVVKLYTGRSFEVSRELINLALESADEFTYRTSNGKKRSYDLRDKRCLKFTEIDLNEAKEVFSIIRRLERINKYEQTYFVGSKELKESGRIHLIKELMLKDNISAEECIKKYRDNRIKDQYGYISNVSLYCRTYEEMLK